jgi:hypothetical protein
MIGNDELYREISEEFTFPVIVDQEAKKLGLISEERSTIEEFIEKSDLKDIDAKSILDVFGYDFSGFLSFLTGNEIKAIFPALVHIILFEGEKCEDLDMSFLGLFSQITDYDRSRLHGFKSGLSEKQIQLVKEFVIRIFETLDITILSAYDLTEEAVCKTLDS